MKPVEHIEACRTSHQRLLADVAPLTDDDLRSPYSDSGARLAELR